MTSRLVATSQQPLDSGYTTSAATSPTISSVPLLEPEPLGAVPPPPYSSGGPSSAGSSSDEADPVAAARRTSRTPTPRKRADPGVAALSLSDKMAAALAAEEKKGAYRAVPTDVRHEEGSPAAGSGSGSALPLYTTGGAASPSPPSGWAHISNNPALPVLSYCGASILMTVVNKFVVSGHHFTMNFLLLTIQSTVCVACVVACKAARIITYRDFDTTDARRWFPVSFCLVVVIYTGSKALQFLSIPVYTIFKNLTIILIAYGEVIWFSGSVTRMTLFSFGLMVLSSFVAAWSDISNALFSSPDQTELDPTTGEVLVAHASYAELITKNAGYGWMLVNCLASAAYVLAMRKRIKVTGFKDWDTMFYNNLLSIPVLVVFSILFEDWSSASLDRNFPAETRSLLLFAMAFSGAAAVFISYTTAWCVRTTSSTTYSMVGALNKLPVAASGMLFFGDPVTLGSVSAVLIGFLAGVTYSVAKIAQSKAAPKGAGNGVELKPR